MTPAARIQSTIDLLTAIDCDGRAADRVAHDYFRSRRFIGAKDRRAVSDITFAVLRARARLGFWLSRTQLGEAARSRVLAYLALGEGRPLREIEALFDASKYGPEYLTGDEKRGLLKLVGHGLDDPAQPLSVRAELPAWLAARLDMYGEEETSALRDEAPLDLRVNLLKADRANAKQLLEHQGIVARETPLSPLGLRVRGRPNIANSEAFAQGLIEVQDEGSQLAAILVDARPGMRVADFCAGAGGKTLALAAAMDNRGKIVAGDVLKGRLDRSAARLRRAGVHNVERRLLKDHRDPWIKRHRRSFERVLVDAPCSGLGTWRRNPEARWRLDEAGLIRLVKLQAEILESAARLVAPGGRLVYVTCSLLPEENHEQIDAFLTRDDAFSLLAVGDVWAETIGTYCPADGPMLTLTPARNGTDGFFVAILERKGETRDVVR